MATSIGDEEYEIEAKVEHTTAKAWLIEDSTTGKQAWLPKSVGRIIRERDDDGNLLFAAPEWWVHKNRML